MLKWFNHRRHRKRTAHNLYGSIVTTSRQPVLFAEYGVPDTVEGRFELLLAHLFLVLECLHREGESAAPLAQNLVDVFFADLDTSVRELGVGDMAVPKKMRKLATVMKERMAAYQAAMADEDDERLVELLSETLILEREGPADVGASFAAYMHNCRAALQRQPVEMLHDIAPDASLLADMDTPGQR